MGLSIWVFKEPSSSVTELGNFTDSGLQGYTDTTL